MNFSIKNYSSIVLFTGAGMSAESGVPTYRGEGGIWNEYKWEEYACQNAFNKDPEFYDFTRSLKAYRETFNNKGDVLLLDPDSDYFKYLNKSEPRP